MSGLFAAAVSITLVAAAGVATITVADNASATAETATYSVNADDSVWQEYRLAREVLGMDEPEQQLTITEENR